MNPLTPSRAVAWAAILEVHPRRLPHWAEWVRELREWASAQTETEPEEESTEP